MIFFFIRSGTYTLTQQQLFSDDFVSDNAIIVKFDIRCQMQFIHGQQ